MSIQKGTRAAVPWLWPAHEKMRLNYNWYYRWHAYSFTNTLHWAMLITFTLGVAISIGLMVIFT